MRNGNMGPEQGWRMTYGEFWPLYHQVVGTATKTKPMSAAEFHKLHESWAKGA